MSRSTKTPERNSSSVDFPTCIGCQCKTCNGVKRTCNKIKKLIQEKLNVKLVNSTTTPAINLCEAPEMKINYTYKEMGRQVMILDIGAHVIIAGVSWLTQYLKEFGLMIDQMKSTSCNQPFVFGPSKRYISKSLIELPVLGLMDEKMSW